MSTTTEHEELAQELHELEVHEEALERRTRSLELGGPLALIFSFVAMAAAIGALVVALNADSDNTADRSVASANSAGVPATGGLVMGMSDASSGMMMGAGGHGQFTAAEKSAAAHGTVYVQLGDFWAAPTVASVRAGEVSFKAKNVGKIAHEFMIERMPMKFSSPNEPIEGAAQGMIEDMRPGASGSLKIRLNPGMYTIFCNLPGHYASGQHLNFRVTA